ncbi:MAG: glutamate--tRNA ligase family protein, partial [Pseudomonadota bacterium]
YQALGWEIPRFAHIPLIHGPDGAKLSKRHGALGVEAYRDMGYLPEAMRNYLARLGWSHGDDEFFTTEQAIAWFGLDAVGKSPARFDFAKLENLNGQHMRSADDARLVEELEASLLRRGTATLAEGKRTLLLQAMPGLKDRAKTLIELEEIAYYLLASRPLEMDAKATKLLDDDARALLSRLASRLEDLSSFSKQDAETLVRGFAEDEELKLGKVAQPLRAALTGRAVSPGVFDVMETLGRDETLARLADVG